MHFIRGTSMKRRGMMALTVATVCAACGSDDEKSEEPTPPVAAVQPIALASLGQPIKFTDTPLPAHVRRTFGLGEPEFFGRWTTGKLAIIEFSGTLPQKFDVTLVAAGYGPNIGAKARVVVGAVAKDVVITGDLGAPNIHVVGFEGITGESIIAIDVATPTSPAELGKSDDTRKLGLALVSMTITPRP